MGRKGVELGDDRRWVFNRLARDYRARPPYPAELLDRLTELAGGAGRTAVDVGAGTGLVALPLAARGLRVLAVEPARAMLEVLTEAARATAGATTAERDARAAEVVPVHGCAEATGLESACADLAVVADALQWVDPSAAGRELARVVRRGGVVAVVEPVFADTPFMRGVAALVEAANFKARRPGGATRRAHLLGAAAGRGRTELHFRQAWPLAPAELDGVLRSLSLVGPALAPETLARLLDDARRLAADCGGAVWARDIALSWCRTR